MALVSLDEIKVYAGITSLDANANTFYSELSNYVSASIESYCNRKFQSAFYTEYKNGGSPTVLINNPPINNVSQVAEYNGTEYANLVFSSYQANTDIEVIYNEETGTLTKQCMFPGTFYNYAKGVLVSYNGGYDEIPLEIKKACLDWIGFITKKQEGYTSTTTNTTGLTIMNNDLGVPAHIKRVLDYYRI